LFATTIIANNILISKRYFKEEKNIQNIMLIYDDNEELIRELFFL